jgi:iron complex transport system ATP-binding protein
MMRAESVKVQRKGRPLLDNVDLELMPGEVLVLLGPNGAGKSTLMRVLSGESIPTSGRVWFGERLLERWEAAEIAKVRAILPQESQLNFALTALETVLLGRYPHNGGRDGAHDLAVARAALERTDALRFAERSYLTLSGGERARVQLARSLCQIWEPQTSAARCLLLDEPTASLDAAHQHLALGAARRFAREEGAAVCAALHDFNLAAQYGDRIAVLDRGRLIACGAPWEVFTEEFLRRAFGVETLVMRHPRLDRPLIAIMGGKAEP